MTKPTLPPPLGDPRFARDVARQLDRRRVRRKLGLWTVLLALVAAAVMYLRCGAGFGLGGSGQGTGTTEGSPRPLAGPLRCLVRVSSTGITVDGKPMSRDEAVAACKAIGGVEATETGGARAGDWTDLLDALRAAGLTDIVVHEPPPGGATREGSSDPPSR